MMSCRQRLEELFAAERVPFTHKIHPEAYTAQDVASSEHISGYDVAKVVIANVDGALAMLVLPAPSRVDLDRVRSTLQARTVRLAEEGEFAGVFADCETGAMPPFGNLYQISVYCDPSLAAHPQITFNAGTHRETMTIAYKDFERLVHPTMIALAKAGAAV